MAAFLVHQASAVKKKASATLLRCLPFGGEAAGRTLILASQEAIDQHALRRDTRRQVHRRTPPSVF